MHVTVRSLARRAHDGRAVGPVQLARWCPAAHVQPGGLRARHVEGGVAVRPVALDARAGAALVTDIAEEAPPGGGNERQPVDGLQEHGVRKTQLQRRRPNGTNVSTVE